jgi:regulator of RNase E activity RraA
MKKLFILIVIVFFGLSNSTFAQIKASPESIKFYTPEWTGERTPDGRPKVEDQYLKRLLGLSIEEAWGVMKNLGYNCQFEGGFQMVHDNQPIVGRAVTAQYLPLRPDVYKAVLDKGHAEGFKGNPNSWPIDVLKNGDIYVADARGKIIDGTLIGDNLGNSIYAKSKNGVVFDGSARDLEGLQEIEGFNAFVRGFDPSFILDITMMGINVPIQIGRAIVIPGDVVMAKKEGVIFIPAHLVKKVVTTGEFVMIKDKFGHQALREGWFTTGQIDMEWTAEIKQAFKDWLAKNPGATPLSKEEMDEMFKERNW